MAAPSSPFTGVGPVRATVVQIRRNWSLRHRNDELRPFLLTLCVSGIHRDHATLGGSLLCSWSMASFPGDASIPSSLPTVVEVAREVFLSLGWAQGVVEWRNRCRGGAPRARSLRQKFKGHRPLFMGLLTPDRSRENVLAILSLTELDPTLAREKSRRGESRSVTSSLRTRFQSHLDRGRWVATRVLLLGRLAGSDGSVARPPLRCARPRERAGRAGSVPWLTGFWPNWLRGNSKTPLFSNLFLNYKLI
jgi:hypothetical protein